jgi:hypothetical protein
VTTGEIAEMLDVPPNAVVALGDTVEVGVEPHDAFFGRGSKWLRSLP